MDCKKWVSVGKGTTAAVSAIAGIGVGMAGGWGLAFGTATVTGLCAASLGLGCAAIFGIAGIAVAGAALGPGGGLEALAGCPKPNDPNISAILQGQIEIREKLEEFGEQLDDLGKASGFNAMGRLNSINYNIFYINGH